VRHAGAVSWWLGVALMSTPASAQEQQQSPKRPEQTSQLQLLGANVLLGGVSAGIVALLRGEPWTGSVLKGVAGGAVVYGGKRIVVERWPGAGILGRQVALLGGSVINNGGAGRGAFDRIAFGFGPARGYVDRDNPGIDWGLDVPGVLAVLWGVMDPDRSLDISQSVSSGAVVFVGDGAGALPGTIHYYRSHDPDRTAYVLAHERVHLLQYDQTFLAVGKPAETWVAGRLPDLGLPFVLEFNAVSLATALALAIHAWPVHADQPWEREAMSLGRIRQ
jgi:hypothetical protein